MLFPDGIQGPFKTRRKGINKWAKLQEADLRSATFWCHFQDPVTPSTWLAQLSERQDLWRSWDLSVVQGIRVRPPFFFFKIFFSPARYFLMGSFSVTSRASSMSSVSARMFAPYSTRYLVANKERVSQHKGKAEKKNFFYFERNNFLTIHVLPLWSQVKRSPSFNISALQISTESHQVLQGLEVVVCGGLMQPSQTILVGSVNVNGPFLCTSVELLGSIKLTLTKCVEEEDVHIKVVASLEERRRRRRRRRGGRRRRRLNYWNRVIDWLIDWLESLKIFLSAIRKDGIIFFFPKKKILKKKKKTPK